MLLNLLQFHVNLQFPSKINSDSTANFKQCKGSRLKTGPGWRGGVGKWNISKTKHKHTHRVPWKWGENSNRLDSFEQIHRQCAAPPPPPGGAALLLLITAGVSLVSVFLCVRNGSEKWHPLFLSVARWIHTPSHTHTHTLIWRQSFHKVLCFKLGWR